MVSGQWSVKTEQRVGPARGFSCFPKLSTADRLLTRTTFTASTLLTATPMNSYFFRVEHDLLRSEAFKTLGGSAVKVYLVIGLYSDFGTD